MFNAVYFNSYKLKKAASVPDFIAAISNLFKENIINTKGHVSSALLLDGEIWADYSIWETMEDLNAFITSSRTKSANGTNGLAERFYSFCNFSVGRSHRFSVKGCYNFDMKHFITPNIVSYHSYKLKKGVSVSDFMLALEKANTDFASKQKGWISSKLLSDGKTWADIAIFESKEDLEQFAKLCGKNELTKKCQSFMDIGSLRSHLFSLEKSFCFK